MSEIDKIQKCQKGKHEFIIYNLGVGQTTQKPRELMCKKCLYVISSKQVEIKNKYYDVIESSTKDEVE